MQPCGALEDVTPLNASNQEYAITLKRTLWVKAQAGAMECLRKKERVSMPKNGDLLFLKDIKDFTSRKLYVLAEDKAILFETRISDNKPFINELSGIEAVKTIYREKKRIVKSFPKIDYSYLRGWVYGVNVQIKNKKGQVTQIRQYASNFNNNKKLIKKINYD